MPNRVEDQEPVICESTWNGGEETVRMIELAAGQVEAAVRESNLSVDVLTNTFSRLATTLCRVDDAIAILPDFPGGTEIKEEIKDGAASVAADIRHAVVAFQFYDKLAQRLDHVCHSLEWLSELVGDRQRSSESAEWTMLQARIREKYTMAEERGLFEDVMRGIPVKEAIERYAHEKKDEAADYGGDIELF